MAQGFDGAERDFGPWHDPRVGVAGGDHHGRAGHWKNAQRLSVKGCIERIETGGTRVLGDEFNLSF